MFAVNYLAPISALREGRRPSSTFPSPRMQEGSREVGVPEDLQRVAAQPMLRRSRKMASMWPQSLGRLLLSHPGTDLSLVSPFLVAV